MEQEDLSIEDFWAAVVHLTGKSAMMAEAKPGGAMRLTAWYQGCELDVAARTRRRLLEELCTAADVVAVQKEHS